MNLSGLELRKVVLFKVLGWEYWADLSSAHTWIFLTPDDNGQTLEMIHKYGMLKQSFEDTPVARLAGNTPAIESNANVSEALFQEWCDKHGYQWEMWRNNHTLEISGISLSLTRHGRLLQLGNNDRVYGRTPSEARARAMAVFAC